MLLNENDILLKLGILHQRSQEIARLEDHAARARAGQPYVSPFTEEKLRIIERTDELLRQWEQLLRR